MVETGKLVADECVSVGVFAYSCTKMITFALPVLRGCKEVSYGCAPMFVQGEKDILV